MQNELMPTCLIFYKDQTMQFMSFDSSIKTTVYRKFNEVANRITTEEITEVLYVGEMYLYSNNENILNLESSERIKHKHSESLVFFKASHDELTNSCYLFDTEKIDDMDYIVSVLHQKESMIKNLAFMNPVINEFKRLNLKK